MKIGIIGCGVVGKAIAHCYGPYHTLLIYDRLPERRTHSLGEVVVGSDLVFICLPTPPLRTSHICDICEIQQIFNTFKGHRTNFVLKSTVPIGTTKWLAQQYKLPNLVYSPEFLTERTALIDSIMPAHNIIGELQDPYAERCSGTLEELYRKRSPGTKITYMTSCEAEAVKLMVNGFFAVKVSYFNELRALCKNLRLSWTAVHESILADGRIAHSHTDVPGHDGQLGFGGKCLPKDLATLLNHMMTAETGHFVTGGADLDNRTVFRKDVFNKEQP